MTTILVSAAAQGILLREINHEERKVYYGKRFKNDRLECKRI